jgi:gliding motility-associated-like protein
MIKSIHRIIFLVIWVCLFSISSAKAEHITGADISYRHISGNTYEFTLQVFADCDVVASPPSFYSISYVSAICGVSSSFDVNQVSETDISPVCPTIRSSCQGGTGPGINRFIYRGRVNLPNTCADWVFRWRECNRADGIANLNSGTYCLFLEAKLNNLIGNNSSPSFTNDANGFVCINQLTQYNPGAVESDGDRLSFTSISPLTNINTNIPFRAGLSPTNPLPNTTGFSVENSTGRISFTSTAVQRSAVAVLVQEFRNGTFIGSVMRDMQFLVRDCANELPVISGIDSTSNFEITACAGEVLSMKFIATDQDAGQNINLAYSGGLQGANFSQQRFSNRQRGTLRWTVPNNTTSGIAIFTITATDNACPVVGQRSATFTIRYSGSLSISGPDFISRVCTTATILRPQITGGQAPYTYLWPDNSTADTFSTDSSGIVRLEVTDNLGCKVVKNYILSSEIPSRIDSLLFCSISGTTKVIVDTVAVTGTNWVFEGGPTFTTRQINPLLTPGDHRFTLTLTDTLGCTKVLRDSVVVCPSPPRFRFEVPDSVCCLENITIPFYPSDSLPQCKLQNVELFINGRLFNNFSFLTGLRTAARIPSADNFGFSFPRGYVSDTGGVVPISFRYRSIGGCESRFDTVIKVLPFTTPVLSFQQLFLPCNELDSVARVTAYSLRSGLSLRLNARSLDGLIITGDSIFSDIDTLQSTIRFRGHGKLILELSNGSGCSVTDTMFVNYPITAIASINNSCERNTPVRFTNSSRSNFPIDSVRWDFGDGSFSNLDSPTHLYANEGVYRGSLTVVDVTGCQRTTNFTATHSWITKRFAISKDTICFGETIMIRPNTSFLDSTYTYIFYDNRTRNYPDSNAAKINYEYPVTGNQNLIHRLNYGAGCTELDTLPIFIIAPVELGVNLRNNCIEDTATITARVISTPSPIVEYKWNLQFSPTRNGTYTFIDSLRGFSFRRYFPTRGFVKARLTVRTQQGCITSFDTTFRIVEVAPPVITTSGNCLNEPVVFAYDSTSDLYENVESIRYDFGDNTTSQTPNGRVNKLYNATGTYNVIATAFSNEGCFNTRELTIVVNPVPSVSFIADSVCLGTRMQFDASASSVEGGIADYTWQFDSLGTSSGVNTSFAWPFNGTFNAKLTVRANNGCLNTLTKQVKVFNLPIADFTFDPQQLVRGEPIQFTDASENALTWQWDYGDGETFFTRNASERSPSHTYKDVAQFNVRLIVTSGSGCSDTIIKRVDLNPKLLLPTAYTPNGDGNNDELVIIKRFIKQIDEFLIYDRWGRKVWESNKQFDDAWDGKVNDVLAEQGVYQVFLKATTIYGDPISVKSSVTLIR